MRNRDTGYVPATPIGTLGLAVTVELVPVGMTGRGVASGTWAGGCATSPSGRAGCGIAAGCLGRLIIGRPGSIGAGVGGVPAGCSAAARLHIPPQTASNAVTPAKRENQQRLDGAAKTVACEEREGRKGREVQDIWYSESCIFNSYCMFAGNRVTFNRGAAGPNGGTVAAGRAEMNARLTLKRFSVHRGLHRQKHSTGPAGMSKYVDVFRFGAYPPSLIAPETVAPQRHHKPDVGYTGLTRALTSDSFARFRCAIVAG